MLSFWTRFRPSLLLSSPSSPGIIYYSVLLWIMDNGLNRLLYYRGMYWLVLGGKRVCTKLQIISLARSQDLVTGGRTSVSFPRLTTGMSSLPPSCVLAVTTTSPYGTEYGEALRF